MRWPQARVAQTLFDFIRDRLNLPRIRPAAHDKIIGKCSGAFLQFQDGNLFRLLLLASVNGLRYLSLQIVLLHEMEKSSVASGALPFYRVGTKPVLTRAGQSNSPSGLQAVSRARSVSAIQYHFLVISSKRLLHLTGQWLP